MCFQPRFRLDRSAGFLISQPRFSAGLFYAWRKMANPVGRPPKYKTVKEMQKAIDEYFDEAEVVTVSGLAYHLGMSTEALRNYEQKDKFLATVKKAKQRVEISLERQLLMGRNATGPIFNLKNNFGWKDKSEQELTGKDGAPIQTDSSLTIEFVKPKKK